MNRRVLKDRFPEFIQPIAGISLIFIIIIINDFTLGYITNEYDRLPFAKQFFEGNWLPNDWYLNLDISYHDLFMFIFGGLISHIGFQNGVYIGRLVIYLLLSCAIYDFYRTFRIRLSIGVLVLVVFLYNQSIVAGEWLVNGLSGKTIAYAFVLFSSAAFYRKQYLRGFAFAGAAISFHVLVGLYAGFCLFVALILTVILKSGWRVYLKNIWPIFITGIFGFMAIAKHLISVSQNETNTAWEIYVQYRVPHHLLPSHWGVGLWILKLLIAAFLGLAVYFRTRSHGRRFIAAYLLGSLSLFLIGLMIYATGEIHLLRFYWFRFPDMMVPFLSIFLIGLFLDDFISGKLAINGLSRGVQIYIQEKLKFLIPLTAAVITVFLFSQSVSEIKNEYHNGAINIFSYSYNKAPVRETLLWIADNTPEEAVFLVDPMMMDFYIYAQRSLVVSFKHSPQSADDITNWYQRIKLINNNHAPKIMGFGTQKELTRSFYNMRERQIYEIARKYGAHYYLGLPDQKLTFKRVYQNPYYVVYEIDI